MERGKLPMDGEVPVLDGFPYSGWKIEGRVLTVLAFRWRGIRLLVEDIVTTRPLW